MINTPLLIAALCLVVVCGCLAALFFIADRWVDQAERMDREGDR